MCRLMIRRVSTSHTSPAKDLMCYKRGDIVLVLEDGESFGSQIEDDVSKRHVIVEVLTILASVLRHLMDEDEDVVLGGDVGEKIIRRRRIKQFNWGLLTAAESAALDHAQGKAVFPLARLNSLIQTKPPR